MDAAGVPPRDAEKRRPGAGRRPSPMTESITPSSAESTTAAVPTPREDLGVRLFSAPPADFDPLSAEDRALVAFGYPPKPDQHKEPKLYAQWRRRVSRRSTRIEPVF